jgi:hypothetical protein
MMNNIKGSTDKPIWYGVYKTSDLTLQTAFKVVGGSALNDNSQNSYNMVNGVPIFLYNSIVRTSKADFEAELTALNITNPDEWEIPD